MQTDARVATVDIHTSPALLNGLYMRIARSYPAEAIMMNRLRAPASWKTSTVV